MKRVLALYLPAALFVLTALGIALYPAPIEYLTAQLDTESSRATSYAVFVALLVIATVLMPVTIMPLIPMAAAVLGPLPTALLSMVGWTIGAIGAFLLARYLGRPILVRFISLERIDSFIAELPQQSKFFFIVLVRLTIPVDIASYALGLSTGVRFKEYVAGTFVGVSWFSFAFAYMGDALLNKNFIILLELSLVSLAIFGLGWYQLKRSRSNKDHSAQ